MEKLNEIKGKIFTTRGVGYDMEHTPEFAEEVANSIKRHFNNDFGDICKSDIALNMDALKHNLKTDRVLSRYNLSKGDIYIISELHTITEDDGDDDTVITTVMYVDEY